MRKARKGTSLLEKSILGISTLAVAGYGSLLLSGVWATETKKEVEINTIESLTTEQPEASIETPAEVSEKIATTNTITPQPVQEAQKVEVPATGGSCQDWMKQAGITDMANAYELIMRESSCNPNSINKSSGACGIGQQLPCGKWEHTWNDPVGGMIDMQKYVISRYGSWANALAFHNKNHWY